MRLIGNLLYILGAGAMLAGFCATQSDDYAKYSLAGIALGFAAIVAGLSAQKKL